MTAGASRVGEEKRGTGQVARGRDCKDQKRQTYSVPCNSEEGKSNLSCEHELSVRKMAHSQS
jgi:hypothetical protein